jgi:hypothetical protein
VEWRGSRAHGKRESGKRGDGNVAQSINTARRGCVLVEGRNGFAYWPRSWRRELSDSATPAPVTTAKEVELGDGDRSWGTHATVQ